MSKYTTLIAGLQNAVSENKSVIDDDSVKAADAVINMLEDLDEKYDDMLMEATDYAIEHMMPVIPDSDKTDGKTTVQNFTTVLFTTETAVSDPSFDEALKQYPGVRAEDLQERIELDNQVNMENVETDMFSQLKIPLMCMVWTYNTWCNTSIHIGSQEDAGMKDLFSICRNSRDYMDYTIYCSDGQLRLMMKHHDATDHCVCLRIIDEDAYWKYRTDKADNAEAVIKEMTEKKIVESLVPDIAQTFGVVLEEETAE